MTTYRVTFEVEIPGEPPLDQVDEFISFEIGARNSMMTTHSALKNKDMRSFKVRHVDVQEAWIADQPRITREQWEDATRGLGTKA